MRLRGFPLPRVFQVSLTAHSQPSRVLLLGWQYLHDIAMVWLLRSAYWGAPLYSVIRWLMRHQGKFWWKQASNPNYYGFKWHVVAQESNLVGALLAPRLDFSREATWRWKEAESPR